MFGDKAIPVLAAGRPGSNEPFFGSNGHLNASSRADAIKQLGALLTAFSNGSVTFNEKANAMVDLDIPTPAQRRAHVVEAFHDKVGSKWAELGSNIGATLYETINRQGFMRRFLFRADLQQGNDPRINVRFENVTALLASGPSACNPQFCRMRYVMPPEFYIEALPLVEMKEIVRGTSDLMDDVFMRAQEQVMVTEDRAYLNLLQSSIGVDNPQTLLAGGITPTNLAQLRQQVANWGLPTTNLLISPGGWADIVGNAAAWGQLFDPVTQYEIVQTGYIGRILGMAITTDGFRDPHQKVLGPNDVWIISEPINHGGYTDRGPVEANPIDRYTQGQPARGWYMVEIVSMAVTNARSVAYGLRS